MKRITETIDLLENQDDIKYFMDKYFAATQNGKTNPRAYRNLILALSAREIYLELKNK